MTDILARVTVPFWTGIIMGVPKIGKTTLFADFPKPLRVIQFDPRGNAAAYRVRGTPAAPEIGTAGQTIQRIYSKRDPARLLIQIDHFWDDDSVLNMSSGQSFGDSAGTRAYEDFRAIRQELVDEIRAGYWRSLVIDSATYMEIAARNLSAKLDPSKEGKKAFANSTSLLEQDLMCFSANLPCNVGIACHIEEKVIYSSMDESTGMVVRKPKLPGRLRDAGPGGVTEFYRLYVDPADGKRKLQTAPRDGFVCGTSVEIQAPDGCAPTWRSIWSNYIAAHPELHQPPVANAGATKGSE